MAPAASAMAQQKTRRNVQHDADILRQKTDFVEQLTICCCSARIRRTGLKCVSQEGASIQIEKARPGFFRLQRNIPASHDSHVGEGMGGALHDCF
ncbi:hypothetical protein [Vandammella animalimorsus]|uniref:hypothetical protein n=1 Tax=Vandammella animalimorsus TaxID=2029117 RepID=UPI00117FEC47|nr:hypothetical protein [Vandammella animalimorsus]